MLSAEFTKVILCVLIVLASHFIVLQVHYHLVVLFLECLQVPILFLQSLCFIFFSLRPLIFHVFFLFLFKSLPFFEFFLFELVDFCLVLLVPGIPLFYVTYKLSDCLHKLFLLLLSEFFVFSFHKSFHFSIFCMACVILIGSSERLQRRKVISVQIELQNLINVSLRVSKSRPIFNLIFGLTLCMFSLSKLLKEFWINLIKAAGLISESIRIGTGFEVVP